MAIYEGGVSLAVQQVSCEVTLLPDIFHNIFQEERSAVIRLHLQSIKRKECKSKLSQKLIINDHKQSVERIGWQKIHYLFFHFPISILLLPIDLIRVRPNQDLNVLLYILILQFTHQFEVLETSVEVINKYCDHQSQDFRHDVSKDECDNDECEDGIDALYWIFGCDISVGDGGDDGDAVVHDIDVGLLPAEDEGHLVEGPAVVDPGEVGGVGAVVVVVVDPHADHVEEDAHIVRVDVAKGHQLYYQVSRVQSDVQLRHALELYVDLARRVDLRQPEEFHPIRLKLANGKRDGYCGQADDVNPKFQSHVLAEDYGDVEDKQSLFVVCLQWRDEDICCQDDDEDGKYGHVIEFVLPEGFLEGQQQSQLQYVVEDDAHQYELPRQQVPVLRSDHPVQRFVKEDRPLGEGQICWWQ